MITEIKKGDAFLCVLKGLSCFTEGVVYLSDKDGTLVDDDKRDHSWDQFERFNKFFEHKGKIYSESPIRKQRPQKNWNKEEEAEKLRKDGLNPDNFDIIPPTHQDTPQLEDKNESKLIRRFPSGAVRSDDTGRPKPSWISPYFAEEVSMVMVDNENDFGACNYMLGIDELACLDSLVRHVGELQEAMLITKDKEASKKVARAVGFNIVSLIHTMVLKEKGLYKEVFKKTELVMVEEAKKGVNFVDKK